MKTWCLARMHFVLVLLYKGAAMHPCPDNCKCRDDVNECYVRTMEDLNQLKNASVQSLLIEKSSSSSQGIKWSNYGFLKNVRKLTMTEKNGKSLLNLLLPQMESLNYLTITSSETGAFPVAAYKGKTLVNVNVRKRNPRLACVYRKIPTRGNCSDDCGDKFYDQRQINNQTMCVCVICTPPQIPSNLKTNTTNNTKTVYVEQEQHKDTIMYSLILAGFSLLALLTNFFMLSRICSCHGLTVIKIFGMSLMIFNVLLAEYGIAIAAYLSQEDHHWDKRFCSGISSVKLFAVNADVFTLTLMIFHKSINPVDGTLEKREVRFKAIVYIFEGLMFSGMAAVISWIKFNEWDYICSIWSPRTTVEKLLTGIEITPHVILLILMLKHLYRGAKKLRKTGHCEDLIELELSPEREHPIFFIVLVTSLIWSIPYIVTAKSTGVTGERASAVIRTCAYLTGAALHPFLFVLRDSWLCSLCCETQIISAEDEMLVCECKGIQMCKNCEKDMSRILAKCEDRYPFEERRKSMSVDNLSLSLPRKKIRVAHPNVKECLGVSNSFPLLGSPIYEEPGNEDQEEGSKQSLSFFLSKFLHEKLPDSIISNGTPKKKKKISASNKLRDSYSSLPLLNSNSPKSTPQRKPSNRVTFRSVHNTPVKKVGDDTAQHKDDVAVSNREEGMYLQNCSSNCNPETEGLLEEFKATELNAEPSGREKGVRMVDGDPLGATHLCNRTNGIDKARKDSRESTSDDQSVSTPDKSDPNRHSRIPTFIPFNSEPGPSGYFADKDSDNQTPTSVASPPLSPAKNEKSKKRKLNGGRKIFKKKSSSKNKDDDKSRVSRGPTFFPFTIEEDSALDTSKRKKSKEEKMKKKKGRRDKHKENDISSDKTQNQAVRSEHRTVSMDSLEWDPSFSLSDSSSSPVEELVSPVPPMRPSPFALKAIEQARQSSSSYGSAGRGSSYSMEWDPTAVQPRVVTPQCEWEPYSVEEPGSSSSSNGVTGTLNSTRSELETANVAAV